MFKKGQKPPVKGKAKEEDLEGEVKKEGKAGVILKAIAKKANKPKKHKEPDVDEKGGKSDKDEDDS